MSRLVCFGLGYSARCWGKRLLARGWSVHGTTRSAEKAEAFRKDGFSVSLFDGEAPSADIASALENATHLLASIAPDAGGDPVLVHHGDEIRAAPSLGWIGYLSTVGVYGNHDGAWVDEETPTKPVSERSTRRVRAEEDWLNFSELAGVPVQIFRLSGIYGPQRGPLNKLKAGESRRIVKPGQVFNRIHVEDIANALDAAIDAPAKSAIYNVSDDEPAPPQDVIAYAAELLGVAPPPEVAFADADLSPMGRSFYGENKRVSNAKVKSELGMAFNFPTYREGMAALVSEQG